ncbi:hypothetical protein AFLA_007686 [Aspergillus flavus NRRL3357]|nr:hypothetical protein AFLA_007686 [Aspergillus flavus NRRL3357]
MRYSVLAGEQCRPEVALFRERSSVGPDYGRSIELGSITQGTGTYYGVELDSQLSMEAYKAEVSNKADTSLNAFKDTVGSTWGAKSAALRGIYLAVVHPQMLYGAIFCFDPGLITVGV